MEKHSHDDHCKMTFWDRMGVFVSGLCLVHCLLTPVFILFLPNMLDTLMEHEEGFHDIILVAVLFIASIAFYRGYKKHKKKEPFILLLIGISLIGFISLFDHHHLEPMIRSLITVVGSGFLILAHIRNHACGKCLHDH